MKGSGLLYTGSRLYFVTAPPFGRIFLPGDLGFRRVVGFRTFNNKEMSRDPLSGLVIGNPLYNFLSLIDAATGDVVLNAYPLNVASNLEIISQTKAAGSNPEPSGSAPVVRPLDLPGAVNVGGSWISNVVNFPVNVAIELFYNDDWQL